MLIENLYDNDSLIKKFDYPNVNEMDDFTSYLSTEYEYINISPVIGLKYRGDFYGLLQESGISSSVFYLTLRLNGLTASHHYDGTVTRIRVLKEDVANTVVSLLKN